MNRNPGICPAILVTGSRTSGKQKKPCFSIGLFSAQEFF
jgi:hypothetical protein